MDNGFGSLGFKVLGVLYLSQMFGSIFSAAICSKIGIKATFILGGLNLAMVAVCQIAPAIRAENRSDSSTFVELITGEKVCISILFLGSVLAGFGQAVMWVA